MNVQWTDLARDKWKTIADYILSEFGAVALQEYAQETQKWQSILENMPSIGKIEPLLINRGKEYHFIIIRRLTKVVYYIDGNDLIIANVWDTRQEPNVQLSMLQ